MTSPRTTAVSSTQKYMQAMALMVAFGFLGVVLTGGRVVEGAVLGMMVFGIYRVGGVGLLLCRAHRRGMQCMRAGKPAEALQAFEESAARWHRRAWLDQRRGWLLGSTSHWSFHARALYNQGVCLQQLGRGEEAIAVLDVLREQHGDMGIAAQLRGFVLERLSADPSEDWTPILQEGTAPPH